MGLLTEMSGAVQKASGKKREAHNVREAVIESGVRIFEQNEEFQAYKALGTLLESSKQKDTYNASLTLVMLERVRSFMEGMKEMYGEATVTTNLGALPKRVLDIVRKAA